jgi:ACT domain-containing protein
MKIEYLVELRDAPGQLGIVLGIVSRHGGNIVSIVHERERARGEYVPVRLVLDVAEDALDVLTGALRAELRVVSVSGRPAGTSHAFLLLGHVFRAQIGDLTDALFAAGADVRHIRAEIDGREKPSAVLIEFQARDANVLAEAEARLTALARERGLQCIGALAGGASA